MALPSNQGSPDKARSTASHTIPKDDDGQITQAISVVAHAFKNLPISLAVISDVDNASTSDHDAQPEPQPQRPSLERRMQHFGPQIRQLSHSGAEIVQTGDWSVVAVWCLPGFTASPSTFKPPFSAVVKEYISICNDLQAKYMPITESQITHGTLNGANAAMKSPGEFQSATATTTSKARPFYHLEFIARNFEKPSIPGAISAAINPFLQRARQEGVPAWLEAGSPQSRAVYERYGFRVAEKITVGQGRFDASGTPKVGGEGVNLWAMIYDEHLR